MRTRPSSGVHDSAGLQGATEDSGRHARSRSEESSPSFDALVTDGGARTGQPSTEWACCLTMTDRRSVYILTRLASTHSVNPTRKYGFPALLCPFFGRGIPARRRLRSPYRLNAVCDLKLTENILQMPLHRGFGVTIRSRPRGRLPTFVLWDQFLLVDCWPNRRSDASLPNYRSISCSIMTRPTMSSAVRPAAPIHCLYWPNARGRGSRHAASRRPMGWRVRGSATASLRIPKWPTFSVASV